MGHRLGVWFALLTLSLVLGVGSGSGTPAATMQVDRPEMERDSTLLRVDLQADGTAVWTVSHRTRLEDANETAAFESLAQEVRADPTNYTARFARRMEATAAAAANATGRQMSIGKVTVSAETTAIPAQYGVLSYRFEWVGFARVVGNRLLVDESLAGLFLDEGTRLLVTWPEGYEVVEVDPTPTERRDDAVVWAGPTEFGPGEPRVGLTTDGRGALAPIAAGVAVLVAVGVGLFYVTNRTGGSRGSGTPQGSTDGGDVSAGSSDPDPALLSNEEQVVRALRAAGGRMRQQELVSKLGWTEAKTSQVLGRLREDGTVESFRLGRENVLRLPTEGLEGER